MNTLLGSAFAPLPVEPVEIEPPADDLLALRLELVLTALDQLAESLHNLPTPQVIVDAPDLSAIVTAVNGLRPGVDADDIARAVVNAITPGSTPDRPEWESELVKTLKNLDFRLKGVGSSGGGMVSDVSNRADRALGVVSVSAPTGTFGYTAGTAGTVTLSGGKRVQTIAVHCTTAGTLTINAGASIPIPANSVFSATYADGKLTDPTLVVTGSDSYYVDWLA